MVIELLPSTTDNLLGLALLEREDDGKKFYPNFQVTLPESGLSLQLVQQGSAGSVNYMTSVSCSSLLLMAYIR